MTRKSLRRAKFEKNKKTMEGVSHYKKVALIQKKNEYMTNLVAGRYYTERCNIIVMQLNSKVIQEKIDGVPKTEEFMQAEYGLMKMQATTRMRNAYFAKKALMEEFGLSQIDIEAMEKDFYEGKIIRENYGDEFRKPNKAEFVPASEDKKS